MLVRFWSNFLRHFACFANAACGEILPRIVNAATCMLLHTLLVVLYFAVICYVAYRFWRMDRDHRDDDLE